MSIGEVGSLPTAATIAGRYAIEARLGQGGMAVVYRVRDAVTGRQLALKKLTRASEALHDRLTRLFEHEYQTLSHLAHPRIVAVYEYGVDESWPYYTMELLAGDDLSRVDRLDWRSTCSLLRDVASALAVLHSRRWVHRDVTPRNVRIDGEGRAKLIDFGALTAMGASAALLVGTPPFVPPEALYRQALDGRTDLYSLGALGYRLLTGDHAYPARAFEQLRECWRTDPEEPTRLVPEVPRSLSELLLSLLSLDVLGRPTSAWEVIERLGAIAELPADRELGTARAYLVTPSLVGRDPEVRDARARLVQASRGRGSSVLIKGPAGAGRTRLLSSFVLEARLLGWISLRAADGEGNGEFALMRALLHELVSALPPGSEAPPPEVEQLLRSAHEPLTEEQLRPLLADGRAALVQFLLSLSERRGLLIAVDDIQLADDASFAVVVELAQAAPRHKLVVALSVRTDPRSDENDSADVRLQLLAQSCSGVQLQPMTAEHTEALMRSVFGDVAHLKPLAHYLHGLTLGNPGTCMSLAQQLLDRGTVRYESGRFILPSNPNRVGSFANLRDAFFARISALSPAARELAEVLSLVDPLAPIRPEHFAMLLEAKLQPQLFSARDELRAADILLLRGDSLAFGHPTLAEALRQEISPRRARQLHFRLAALYASEAYGDVFMQAWHLQQAGEDARACELIEARARALNHTDGHLLRHKPRYRLSKRAYLAALEHCERTAAPARMALELRRAIVNLASYYDTRLVRHALPVIEQLRSDTGLSRWAELESIADPTQRMMKCLALAKERYDATPEHERCLDPGEAVRSLGYQVGVLAGAYGRTLDLAGMESLPPLVEPFRALAPAIDVLAEVVGVSLAACRGLETRARAQALLARIESQPDFAASLYMRGTINTMRYYLGVWHARCGGRRGLLAADEIEERTKRSEQGFPAYVGLGRYRSWHIRLLTHLFNGEGRQAKACRERIELLQLDGLDPLVTPNVRTGAYLQARAHAISGSLAELRDAVDVIAELSQGSVSWSPVLQWARGEYHKARGDFTRARSELQAARAETAPGGHIVWVWATCSLVEVMLQCGEPERAHEIAERALRDCAGIELTAAALRDFERVLALAQAALGQHAAAAERLEHSIALAEGELGGVPLGQLYEARAQVALLARDGTAFSRYAHRVGELYRPGGTPGLVARHARLLEDAERFNLRTYDGSAASDAGALRTLTCTAEASMVKAAAEPGDPLDAVCDAMQTCQNQRERAERALALLIEHTGADHGALYALQPEGLRLVACSAGAPPPPELGARLALVLARERDEITELVDMGPSQFEAKRLELEGGVIYHPIILRSGRDSEQIVTAAAALCFAVPMAPNLPWRLCRAISDYLLDAGDVVSLVGSDSIA